MTCKLRLWCSVGFLISLYATYVEIQLILNENYKAFCDVAPNLSCTAVFSSDYGKSFGFLNMFAGNLKSFKWNPPNGIYGLIYYLAFFITTFFESYKLAKWQCAGCIAANLMSLYLAYLLYILKNICLVCLAIYLVNILVLWELIKHIKKLYLIQKPELTTKKLN